jgi:very-short-patch-repair endonuclease
VRCLQLDPVEVRRRGPFRVTSIERTLLDFAATSAADNLETALDSALNRGLTAIPRLRNYIDRRAERGRRGMAMLREMVTIRDPRCAPNQSPLETKLARLLRESMLPTPCPQFVVTSTKGFVAKLDFAYPDLRLAIEALGWEYHGGRLRWKRDLNRLNQLTNLGWRTLLFTWSDVVAAPARTLDTLNGAYSSPFF